MISAKNGCHFGCELLSTGRGTLKGVILAYAWWLIYSVSCKSHYVVLHYLAAVDIATRSYFSLSCMWSKYVLSTLHVLALFSLQFV